MGQVVIAADRQHAARLPARAMCPWLMPLSSLHPVPPAEHSRHGLTSLSVIHQLDSTKFWAANGFRIPTLLWCESSSISRAKSIDRDALFLRRRRGGEHL